MTDAETIAEIAANNAEIANKEADNAKINAAITKGDATMAIRFVGLHAMGLETMMKNAEVMDKCVESLKKDLGEYAKSNANPSFMKDFMGRMNKETEVSNKNAEIAIKNADIVNDTSAFVKKIVESIKEEVEIMKNSIEIATKKAELMDASRATRWAECELMKDEDITNEEMMKFVSVSSEAVKDLVEVMKEEAKIAKKNAKTTRKNAEIANAISAFVKKIAEIMNDAELTDEDKDIENTEAEFVQTITKIKTDAEYAKKIEEIRGEKLDNAMKIAENFKTLFKKEEKIKYDEEKVAEIAKRVDFSQIKNYMDANR
jgi:hypothetical protein